MPTRVTMMRTTAKPTRNTLSMFLLIGSLAVCSSVSAFTSSSSSILSAKHAWQNPHHPTRSSQQPQRQQQQQSLVLFVAQGIPSPAGDNNEEIMSSETASFQPPQKSNLSAADQKPQKTSSAIASTTFTVMKAMLGSGVLALSSGLAAVSDHPSSVLPANLLFLVLGGVSAYTFALYGRLCHATQAKSLGDLWKRSYQSDDSTPMSVASFSFCYGSCLIFLLILGDTLHSLLQAGVSSLPRRTISTIPFTRWLISRQSAIVGVTATLLWPLCNLPSLQALAPFSVVGVAASIVSSAFVAWRCPALCPSSPYCAASPVLAALPVQPQFGSYHRIASLAPLVLMGMGGMALMAHFSAPDVYQALRQAYQQKPQEQEDKTTTTTTKNQSLKDYLRVTLLGFPAVLLINAMTLTCGFLTFGGNSAGMILNNYATKDVGAAVSRLLVAISMIGGYPLIFRALKSAANDLYSKRLAAAPMKINGSSGTRLAGETAQRRIHQWLMASLLAISMFVQDAGFVVGLNGALMGSAIIYTFPALMFLRMTKNGSIPFRKGERFWCRALVAFGVFSGLAGGATTIINTYLPHLLT